MRWSPRDRRGATAITFAVSATALLGFAAMATEVGGWYLARRSAQNAADAAALAGVVALQLSTPANQADSIAAAVTDLASENGFTPGTTTTVSGRHPPTSGPNTGNTNAVEVVIRQSQPLAIASLFTDDAPQISARAVAALRNRRPACLVALSGPVTIQNSSAFVASDCGVASNASTSPAIDVPQSNSSVTADSMIAVGTCSGCSGSYMHLAHGYEERSIPITNPYAYLDAKDAPAIDNCLNTNPITVNGPLTAYTTSQRRAYCANVSVANTGNVTMASGTYVFRNASLTIGSIASITCSGCTFLFFGSNPGQLSITNLSTARLSAPPSNSIDPDYDGMLFYRTPSGNTGSSASPTLNLQSVSSFDLAGGIYFPQAHVKIGNVSSTSNWNCLPIIGGALSIGSLHSFRFSTANCANYATKLPFQKLAVLVE